MGLPRVPQDFFELRRKVQDAAPEWIFTVRAYRQAARRVFQPAPLP